MSEEEELLVALVEEGLNGHLEIGQRVLHPHSGDTGTIEDFRMRKELKMEIMGRFRYEYKVKWDYDRDNVSSPNWTCWTWRPNIRPIPR